MPAKRGIANGDKVRDFNDRGEVRLPPEVTPRILPGVSAMGQGAWHNADMLAIKFDHGACIQYAHDAASFPTARESSTYKSGEIENLANRRLLRDVFTRPELPIANTTTFKTLFG